MYDSERRGARWDGGGAAHEADRRGDSVPGRSTLVDHGLDAPGRIQPKLAVQAQGNEDDTFDPTQVQVDQYAPGTDPDRFNDCGPSVILMVVRALRAEPALDKLVRTHDRLAKDAELTVQQRLTYIRGRVADARRPSEVDRKAEPEAKVDTPFSVLTLENALFAILHELQITASDKDLRSMIISIGDQAGFVVTNDMDAGTDAYNVKRRPTAPGSAQRFLEANCGHGSAVIVLGTPTSAAWGWGGQEDPARRTVTDPDDKTKTIPQPIKDTAQHFVMVWSPAPKVYTVMDPSWTTPRENQTIDTLLAFIRATGGGATVSMVALPFAKLRAYMPAQTKRAGGARPAAAAPRPATGPGVPLPRLTLGKMQHAFGADFSAVRVHEDDRAAAIGALAYARGDDVHFAPGTYRPGTPDGDRLIGHELTHVIQQRHGRVAAHASGVVDDHALEAEADLHGDRAAHAADHQPLERDQAAIVPLAGPIRADLLQAVIDAHAAAHGAIQAFDPKSAYGKAVLAVWNECDTELPPADAVHTYGQSAVESGRKRATIGELAARRARLEFLIGWMAQGGIQMSAKNWENGGGTNAQGTDSSTNSGTIVDKYTGYESGYGLNNNDWCGMFVGFAFRHAGMAKGDPAYSELASVPRALAWVKAQKSLGTAGDAMTPDEIWAGTKTPQAGDVVILEHHVSMIERFDAGAKRIDTIDGNVGLLFDNAHASNGVSGASYTATGGPLKILLVYRPGLESFGAKAATGAVSTDNSAGDALVAQLGTACTQLTDLYQKLHLAGAVSDDKSVAQIAADTAAKAG